MREPIGVAGVKAQLANLEEVAFRLSFLRTHLQSDDQRDSLDRSVRLVNDAIVSATWALNALQARAANRT